MWAVLDGLIQRAAVARLRQVSHAIAGPPHTGKQDGSGHWHQVAAWRDVTSRRQITSVEPCGACGTAVELVHPLPRELYDRLPDLSWVRCESCSVWEAA